MSRNNMNVSFLVSEHSMLQINLISIWSTFLNAVMALAACQMEPLFNIMNQGSAKGLENQGFT